MYVGDRVKITLPIQDVRVTQGMKRYNGVTTTISKRSIHNVIRGERTVATIILFELDGIKSAKGMPYTFSSDMLQSIDY